MKDNFTKIGLIVVIILLVVLIVSLSDYGGKVEPTTTTTSPTATTTVGIQTTIGLTTTPTTTVTFDCSNAGFKFVSGSYTKNNAQLTLKLENTKPVSLTMEYIFFTYPNNVVIRKSISGILEGRVLEGYMTRSFLTSQVEDKFISGRVTTDCPDVTAEFTYSDVT